MNIERLVQMANDIGDYFGAEPDREAALIGMATHFQRFWDPRMRRQILEHLQQGGAGLSAMARAALERLNA